MRQLNHDEIAFVAGGATPNPFSPSSIYQWLQEQQRNNWTAALMKSLVTGWIVRPIAQLADTIARMLGIR